MPFKRFQTKKEAKAFEKSKKKTGNKTSFRSIKGKDISKVSLKRGKYKVTYKPK